MSKTVGIVLQKIRIGDNKSIVRLFTKDFGIISGSYRSSKTNKSANNLYQSGNVLLIEFSKPFKGEIGNIKESSFHIMTPSISGDVLKSLIVVFICELLQKTMKDQAADKSTFLEVVNTIRQLDQESSFEKLKQFHIVFLFNLLTFIGIQPFSAKEMLPKEDKDLENLFNDFLIQKTRIIDSKDERRRITNLILKYIEHQIPEIKELKTLRVLEEISG